ncbi:hypothetical protein Taro_020001 [Colocasia esculenta]|uniref:DUF7032 domain-containing protein n=1 Tax=Colocasia esculenta TaxID=4460 RepID=A0A843UXS0_COLES|nr:hypothetical protein [Colocasia esculenta]
MKSLEGQDSLRVSRQLLASLSDSLPAVRSFRGRWSAVSAKLGRLRASLDDLSDLPNLDSNPLSTDLLRSLNQTLGAALDLSLRCHAPDPPAGKLRTQSEISAADGALDQHLADADLLLRTGALLEPPRVAERPAPLPPGSRRELVRVEARNLVTRLQIGGVASKNAALDELIGLLQEDDKNVLIAAAQGAVPALVRLLDLPCPETKEKAVAAISRISSIESCRHVLVAEGVPLLNHLARALDSGCGVAKEKACLALQTLTLTKENARAFGSRGGICSLLEICQAGTPSSQAAAAGVLKNLAAIAEIRAALAEESAVTVLVRMCSSGTVTAQENTIACLRNLSSGEGQDFKFSIYREGGVDCLKNYWDIDGRILEPAAGLLRNLASCKHISDHLVAAGFVARAVAALSSGSAATRTEAARAVHELANGSNKAAKEIGETGCIPRVVRMLEAKGSEEKEAAVMTLASLLTIAENRRLFRKDDRGILNVVQLLDPLLPTVNKKYPISVLASVSQSSKCRKRMVEVGACGFLQRLVDMEVEGARRLLEILGKGKMIWGVFTRT